jgi:glutaredoxin
MGRTTVFTGDDLHSERVKQAFWKRAIPFTEISVARFPSKRNAVRSLALSESLPQVFFNTRHIGGAAEALKELAKWDADSNFSSPLEKYEAQILPAEDPKSICALDPGGHAPFEVPKYVVRETIPRMGIKLPDDTTTTVVDITEKLKASLPREDLTSGSIIYKKSFTGLAAREIFKHSMNINETQAEKFAQHLLESGVILSCPQGDKSDKFNMGSIYRLQAFSKPHILNSYRLWTEPSDVDPEVIAKNLDQMLFEIEVDSLSEDGKIDCRNALQHSKFPKFEDAACELQTIFLSVMIATKALAFGIDVYNLMLRYAFIKIGVCTDEASRLSLLHRVQFNVGGHAYSFREWVDGILRGNNKATYAARPAFDSKDVRRKFSFSSLDYRIHFALNLDPRLGSSTSPSFNTFSAIRIEDQLKTAARLYCGDNNTVNLDNDDALILCRTFAWYKSDFNGNAPQVISNYLDSGKLLALKNKDVKPIKYSDPDWSSMFVNYVPFEKSLVKGEIKGVKKLLRRFVKPKTTHDESLRLATLHSLNLLETLTEERFDRLTRMVKDEFKVPVVYISLIDENRQVFMSKQWFCPAPEMDETDRDVSFCGHVILKKSDEIMVVENALNDDRFADNPLVTGPFGLRFYAGCNLAVPAAGSNSVVNVGTLCIVDQKPRKFTGADIEKLRQYAYRIRGEIIRQEI